MLKIVMMPISVIPSSTEIATNDAWGHMTKRKEKFVELEKDARDELDQALNEGYTIVHTHEFTADGGVWLRYTLHKQGTPAGTRNGVSAMTGENGDV